MSKTTTIEPSVAIVDVNPYFSVGVLFGGVKDVVVVGAAKSFPPQPDEMNEAWHGTAQRCAEP